MRLGKLFSAVVDTVTIPLSVAADIVTLGNVGNYDGKGSYTKEKLEKIAEELDEITN